MRLLGRAGRLDNDVGNAKGLADLGANKAGALKYS